MIEQDICCNCVHSKVCRYKIDYKSFIEEPTQRGIGVIPDFLNVQITCKFQEDDTRVRYTTTTLSRDMKKS